MRRTFRTLILAAIQCGALSWGSVGRAQSEEDLWIDADDPASFSRPSADEGRRGLSVAQMGPRSVPASYSVRPGDTLWAITGHFYGSPYEWPRVWSYNPEITNPHWIYPDQTVRLVAEGQAAAVVTPSPVGRRTVQRGVETGTVFLREQGWLDDDALETAGEIVGSPDDHMMLSPFDQAYVRFDRLPEGQDAPRGEYTIFRAIEADQRNPEEEGTLVRVLGTVRVDSWDESRRTARVTLIEALDPIERGFKVAAIPRRFDVIPPRPSEIELDTRIVATLDSRELVGDQHVVFVPVGSEEGVEAGNRAFIVRAGDQWRRELENAQRDATTVEPPEQLDEYPDEVIAEARVVAVRPHSAVLLITRTTQPIAIGDRAQFRSGY